MTVMICDLVDLTALSARLDPEDMGAVIDAFQAACARIALASDGFLAEFRGDGILAISATRVPMRTMPSEPYARVIDIVAAVALSSRRPAGEPLAVRIGIASGCGGGGRRGARCARNRGSETRRALPPACQAPGRAWHHPSSPPPRASADRRPVPSARPRAWHNLKGFAEADRRVGG